MPLCAIKTGCDNIRKGRRLCLKKFKIKFTIGIFPSLSLSLSFQLDYTEAETCNECFEMRKNVSNANKPCTCTVNFRIDKPFKVRTSRHRVTT